MCGFKTSPKIKQKTAKLRNLHNNRIDWNALNGLSTCDFILAFYQSIFDANIRWQQNSLRTTAL